MLVRESQVYYCLHILVWLDTLHTNTHDTELLNFLSLCILTVDAFLYVWISIFNYSAQLRTARCGIYHHEPTLPKNSRTLPG
jgi:hypothetical protein